MTMKEGNAARQVKSNAKHLSGDGLRHQRARGMTEGINFKGVYDGYFYDVHNSASANVPFFSKDGDNSDAIRIADNIDFVTGVYYSQDKGRSQRFFSSYKSMVETGKKVEQSSIPLVGMIDSAKSIINESYTMTYNLGQLIDAPASINNQFSANVARMNIAGMIEDVGVTKPPYFAEDLRRFVPLWMKHGIAYPTDENDLQSQEIATSPWGVQDERDTNFLMSKKEIDSGSAPLHIALRKADELADQGDAEASYALRTHSLLNVLAAEAEHGHGNDAKLPLFTSALGGLIADYRDPAPKNAHYDYGASIDDTMHETFTRLNDELEEGTQGPANHFLTKLSAYYPDTFADIVALSITKYDDYGQGTDMLPLVRNLDTANAAWAEDVREAIEYASVRRIITSDEVVSLAAVLPQGNMQSVVDEGRVLDDAACVMGSRDVIDFGTNLNRLYKLGGASMDLDLELDAEGEGISGGIKVDDGDLIRYVPFNLSITGDIESMQFPTIDGGEIATDTVSRYHSIVVDALHAQAEKVRKSQPKPKRVRGEIVAPTTDTRTFEVRSMTREERMAMYDQERAKLERKAKRRTDTVLQPGQEIDFQAVPLDASIQGLDRSVVRNIFDEQEIRAVTPDRLIHRVQEMARAAFENGKELGSQVNLESFGPDAEDVNLRQINWTLSGKHTSVLVFIEEEGPGNYIFRGVTERKGKQQGEYITEIVNDIIVEQKSATSE